MYNNPFFFHLEEILKKRSLLNDVYEKVLNSKDTNTAYTLLDPLTVIDVIENYSSQSDLAKDVLFNSSFFGNLFSKLKHKNQFKITRDFL